MPEQSRSVTFKNVSKVWPGGIRAVDGVSIDIAAGSFVALVGASGSGKSTLRKMVNRLIEPSEGAVLVGGEAVDAGPAPELRRRIGYVFQNVGLFPHMAFGENVAIGLRLAGDKDTAARVAELLELVELAPEMPARMPDALSCGQP